MRTFIAIDIPEDLKKQMLVTEKFSDSSIRSLKPEQIHLTLAFLGEIDMHLTQVLIQKLRKIKFYPFSIELSSCGFFPSIKRPSVFWIGVNQSNELNQLKQLIDDAILSCGAQLETRPFKPHITVARIAKANKYEIAKIAKLKENFSGGFNASSFALYSSTLTNQGAVYSKIEEFKASP